MDRRTEILRRAAEIFERKGVSNTSVEDIAGAIGVTREAIYYYFKSRYDILLEILLPTSKTLLNGLRLVCRTDLNAREKLKAALENHLQEFTPGYLEMTVAFREQHFFADTEKATELSAVWEEYGDLWVEIVSEGQKSGEFNAELNTKMVTFGILGMCNWMSRWYDPSKDVSIDEIVDTFFTLSVDGLAAAPAIKLPKAS
ncbi:MAG: TetR/AcrR family transcriptional regulator [Rhodospirillaceae bacterium]|jgi:TetR/AcrR family transcriptional regulator, cholesterol catabolism regulator|nr:TetR/AcrR family transcriptional regulator [Rhodospirillaceae bacterium]MBT4588969.1 TetR/AcrR family transcriptional regulator [Rhodospirillaceae bacterium]MBT4939148.1 TetR/AcrR family transcriptional regulator [Rhodospirillaceae bacterium]MBT5941971.1 TetR/AcrR family transcriptional regulator [Rhodospirillaceae bacterium]MBT7268376.1 TetR/AcrR family transcriptional regulator [Rhodospirillaceae bacterium]